MQIEVQKAMRQGAFGVAAALAYPPTSYQTTDELVLLARSAAKYGGFYATHLRSEADAVLQALDEAMEVGRRGGLPVEVWHLKVADKQNWGRMPEVVQRIAAARADGLDVSANVYPYLAGANMLYADVPGWAQAGGVSEMLGRLRDRDQRARVEKEIAASWKDPSDPDRVVILLALSPEAKRYEGESLADVAKERATTPAAALVDLVLLDGGSTQVLRFLASEFDLRVALRQPWVSIGVDASADAPDGPLGPEGTHPAPSARWPGCSGPMPATRSCSRFEEAVRKVASGAARRLGLTDRGILRPGMMADVVVFESGDGEGHLHLRTAEAVPGGHRDGAGERDAGPGGRLPDGGPARTAAAPPGAGAGSLRGRRLVGLARVLGSGKRRNQLSGFQVGQVGSFTMDTPRRKLNRVICASGSSRGPARTRPAAGGSVCARTPSLPRPAPG